jgi:hypothetical protein
MLYSLIHRHSITSYLGSLKRNKNLFMNEGVYRLMKEISMEEKFSVENFIMQVF